MAEKKRRESESGREEEEEKGDELNKINQASNRKVSWTHSRIPLVSSQSEGTGEVARKL